MEADITLIGRFSNSKLRDLAEFFLNEETRPIFEDEVDQEHRALFSEFEDIDIPTEMEKEGNDELTINWFAGSEFDDEYLGSVCDTLFKCGCCSAAGVVLSDGYPIYRFQRGLSNTKLILDVFDEDSVEYDEMLALAHEEDNRNYILAIKKELTKL